MKNAPSVLRILRGGSLRRAVTTLGSGAAISLLLTYGAQVVLTRLYSAEAFGVTDSFVSIVAILSTVASLRYEDAVMLPESNEEARSVLQLAIVLTACCALLVLLLVLPFGTWFGNALGSPDLGRYLILLPLALIVHRTSELYELWSARRKDFGVISRVHVARTVVTASVRIGAALSRVASSAGGLIGGFIAGFFTSSLLLVGADRRKRSDANTRWSRRQISAAAARYNRFPKYTMPANLLGALNARLPFLWLLFYFDAETVGLFGRAFVAVAIPLSLIGTAVSRVFFVAAAERVRDGTLATLTTTVYARLVSIAIIPIVALVLAGPQLFRIVFGLDWVRAGEYSRLLVGWFAIVGIASPMTRLFDVLEQQRLDLAISLCSFVILTGAIVATGPSGDVWTVLGTLAVAGTLTRLAQLGLLLKIGGSSLLDALRPWLVHGLFSVPLAALLILCRDYSALWLGGAILLGLGIYAALIMARELHLANRSTQA